MPCSASEAQRYLAIAELSRILDLPESTTRYYCKRFAAHLPSSGDGRKKRYAPECVEILQTIIEEMKRNKNAFAVDLALSRSEDARPAVRENELSAIERKDMSEVKNTQVGSDGLVVLTSQLMGLMERQTAALQEIASAMTLFASRYDPVSSEEEQKNLKSDILLLKEAMRLSEEEHKKDLDQTRRWLARFSEALAKRSGGV